MQRSKQQALMFLLGAVLVGGVVGFSFDRVMLNKKPTWTQRGTMYKELGISDSQQYRMDSILDESICANDDLIKPIRPALDSVRKQARADWLTVMTPAQRDAFKAMEARDRQRRDSVAKARQAERADKEKQEKVKETRPTTEYTSRCGAGFRRGGPPGMGPGGPPGMGPGGPGPGPGPDFDRRGRGGPFYH